jgi:hypothetical protein
VRDAYPASGAAATAQINPSILVGELGCMETPINFKVGNRVEADEWSADGRKITDAACLSAMRQLLNSHGGPVLLEHRYLRGARGPDHFVFHAFEDLVEYLSENARAGDNIYVWNLESFLRDAQPLAHGKCPDADGAVPRKGAY